MDNSQEVKPNRSFVIDYSNNRFLKDGEGFRYASGSIHYYRVHQSMWHDRLKKLRMAGFNAVQTYVEWSSHEPEPGVYDFSGMLDLERFLTTAQQEDLVVILRLGPFIDAERDMGGFPYWLLRMNPYMKLRTVDPSYLKYVDNWFGNILLPKIKPHLYANGGPVIMIQVENEYGSYQACDFAYTSHMRDLISEKLDDEVLLFSTDGAGTGYLKCGKIPGVYATVDFGHGANLSKTFGAQRLFEPQGPLVNSEFYPGWLDHWGQPHATVPSEDVAESLDKMLALNASVNMYMFHGGTSFGLTAGANKGSTYQACPTSYDYDAPLSEAGDPTEKYFAIRNITKKYLPLPSGEVPAAVPKSAYGKVALASHWTVMQLKGALQSTMQQWPLTFEDLHMPNGIVVYETTLNFTVRDPSVLSLNDIADRGYIFVDGEYAGIASREGEIFDVPVSVQAGQTISIVVESQGRICVGSGINDFKGLTTNATLDGFMLDNWNMSPVPITNMTKLQAAFKKLKKLSHMGQTLLSSSYGTQKGSMTFYKGSFKVPEDDDHPQDTFLKLDGWTKGIAWVNDFCLGRYWPVMGPQVTLYIPAGVLQKGSNTIMVLELEASPCADPSQCYVSLVDTPQINGPTPRKL